MQKLLVIRGGALGDFLVTLPSLKLLREEFPASHIEILGYRHIIALAERRFYAQATRCIEDSAMAGFFHSGSSLDKEFTQYFAGFDKIISYLSDPHGIFVGNLHRAGAQDILSASPHIGDSEHAAIQLGRPLQALGLRLTDPASVVFPSPEDHQNAEALLDQMPMPFIALHPGSGSEKKNWPIGHWIQLMDGLIASDIALVVVGGESDLVRLDQLKRTFAPSAKLRYVEHAPLPTLAALLARSDVFVGHDSGISHLAAACGARSLLLFGPTNPHVWAPRNARVSILHHHPLQTLTPSEVRSHLDTIRNASC